MMLFSFRDVAARARTPHVLVSQRRLKLKRGTAALIVLLFLTSLFSSQTSANPLLQSQCGMPHDGVYTLTTGRVADFMNRGIEGALVRQDRMPSEYDYTNRYGNYELRIWAHCPTTITASHARFNSGTSGQVGVATPLVGPEFRLLYRMGSPSATPAAFNPSPQKMMTFQIPAGPLSVPEAQVRLQLPTGNVLDLQPNGFLGSLTRWTGTWFPPESLADGIHSYKVCVVSPGAGGNCDAVFSGVHMSLVTTSSFTVDSVAPSISSATPTPNHNTLLRRPKLSVSVSDALAGVDAANLNFQLDGTSVASSWNSTTGQLSFTPASDLGLGLHHVTATVQDKAANVAQLSWEFNVTTLEASPAMGRLREQTVPVNPEGNVLGAPTTVTFTNVQVHLDPFGITLGPSPYAGHGFFSRTISLSKAEVVFNNETGIPSAPVNPNLSPISFTAGAGLLFPQIDPTTAYLPANGRAVSSAMVSVPAGYNTSGSTATIRMDPVLAMGVLMSGADPLPNELQNGIDPISVSAQTNFRIEQNQNGSFGVSSNTTVHASYRPEGLEEPLELFIPGDPQGNYQAEPKIICGPTDTEPNPREYFTPNVPCFAEGQSLLRNHSHVMVISPTLAFHSNHWLYKDALKDEYLAWHQVSTIANDSSCANRTAIRPRIKEVRTSTSQVLLNPATTKSAWDLKPVYSNGGFPDRSDSSYLISEPLLSWGSQNSLTKQARFSASAPPNIVPISDGQGPTSTGPISTGLVQSASGGLTNTIEQMVLGAKYEFRGSDASLNGVIEVVALENWLVDADVVSCP